MRTFFETLRGDMNRSLDTCGVFNRTQYEDWLRTFEWTHFGTFTTSKILGERAGRIHAKRVFQKLSNLCNHPDLCFFWVQEPFTEAGYHLHALLLLPVDDIAHSLMDWHNKGFGSCQIVPAESRAIPYVLKTIGSHPDHYDFFFSKDAHTSATTAQPDLVRLPLSIRRNGARYDLIRRGKKTLIYSRAVPNSPVYYEVFKIKIRQPSTVHGKYIAPAEIWPNDEAFGVWAKSKWDLDQAIVQFDEWESKGLRNMC